jgi:hypothetical protein
LIFFPSSCRTSAAWSTPGSSTHLRLCCSKTACWKQTKFSNRVLFYTPHSGRKKELPVLTFMSYIPSEVWWIPQCRILLVKLTTAIWSRNSLHFMKPKGSLLCSQQPNNEPHPGPAQWVHSFTPHFFMIHSILILPSTPHTHTPILLTWTINKHIMWYLMINTKSKSTQFIYI